MDEHGFRVSERVDRLRDLKLQGLSWCKDTDRQALEFHFDKQSIVELLREELAEYEKIYFEHMERIERTM